MEWTWALMLMRIGLWPFVSFPCGSMVPSLQSINRSYTFSSLICPDKFIFSAAFQSAILHSPAFDNTLFELSIILNNMHIFFCSKSHILLSSTKNNNLSFMCVHLWVWNIPSVCLLAGPGLLSWWLLGLFQQTGHYQPAPDADWRSLSPKRWRKWPSRQDD